MSEKTYTEEEVQALIDRAVAEGTKPLREKLEEYEASEAEERVAEKVAEATKPLEEKIEELQKELDTATLEKQKAADELAEMNKFLEEEQKRIEEEEAVAARRAERVEKVKEVASFPDDYVEKNADRWARMSDEEFEAACADWATISKPGVPEKTGMKGKTETASDDKPSISDMRREVLSVTRKGNTDLRSL